MISCVRKERQQNPGLLFDSGDSLLGSNTVFRCHEPIAELMNEADYTAQAMGNREFNYLRRVMAMREKTRNFPLLCCNLTDLRCGCRYWQQVLEIPAGSYGNSVPLIVTGATPVQYPPGHFWEKVFGFRFSDPLEAVPEVIAESVARGARVIVLSHLGLDMDRKLAEVLPEGSLIIGGHSHTVLEEPVFCGGCWIVQAGSHGRCFGIIDWKPETGEFSAKLRFV